MQLIASENPLSFLGKIIVEQKNKKKMPEPETITNYEKEKINENISFYINIDLT
jgi:hypothetical protein